MSVWQCCSPLRSLLVILFFLQGIALNPMQQIEDKIYTRLFVLQAWTSLLIVVAQNLNARFLSTNCYVQNSTNVQLYFRHGKGIEVRLLLRKSHNIFLTATDGDSSTRSFLKVLLKYCLHLVSWVSHHTLTVYWSTSVSVFCFSNQNLFLSYTDGKRWDSWRKQPPHRQHRPPCWSQYSAVAVFVNHLTQLVPVIMG